VTYKDDLCLTLYRLLGHFMTYKYGREPDLSRTLMRVESDSSPKDSERRESSPS
jgi:hypothetical protein